MSFVKSLSPAAANKLAKHAVQKFDVPAYENQDGKICNVTVQDGAGHQFKATWSKYKTSTKHLDFKFGSERLLIGGTAVDKILRVKTEEGDRFLVVSDTGIALLFSGG